MGIGKSAINLLREESERRPFSGAILTLGRQTVSVPPFDDVSLFKSLGFEKVESLDANNYENATHIVNLNYDVPSALEGQFDVVLDFGTTEHVFNAPKALENVIRLCKVGGRIIFHSPSSNYLDHGFYMFSPTLFWDFFSANKLTIEKLYVIREGVVPYFKWTAYEYVPEAKLYSGALDRNAYTVFAVATKTAHSTSNEIPVQRHYQISWDRSSKPSRLHRGTQKLVGWIPGAMGLAVAIRLRYFGGLRSLRKVGRY